MNLTVDIPSRNIRRSRFQWIINNGQLSTIHYQLSINWRSHFTTYDFSNI
ncbi:MAG: hypothetical protein VKL42_11715 [Snowella sp.]|nr:hypothetical protein [Snowella sp.]